MPVVIKKSDVKQLIRECLDELIHPQYVENRALKSFGSRMVEQLILRGVAVEKWNIYEQDQRTVMFQLYFKLIKAPAIQRLLSTVGTYDGNMRMYPDKNFIGVDIKIDKKNIE